MKNILTKDISRKKLNLDDLESLNVLLQTDIPIKQCLLLIQNNHNKEAIEEIIQKLDEGILIEMLINDYLPNNISQFMKSLLKTQSFKESLNLCLLFQNKIESNKQVLYKSITYPLVLLFVGINSLLLFDLYGLDNIIALMNNFVNDFSLIIFFRSLFHILIVCFYCLVILVSLFSLYFLNNKRISILYILISKYFKNSFMQVYYSEEFASLLNIMLKLGYKTKDALTILKSLINKPVVAMLAFHIEDQLLKGKSLLEASKLKYFDERFAKFINIAIYSNDFITMMNKYVELSQSKIKNKMKLYTTIIQVISYVVIGFVVIFIYQVLFLPMQALSNI